MKRSWWYRFIFLLLVTTVSVVVVIPTALDFNEESNYPVKSKINLGLDLQGGLYMILGIDFNKVFKDEVKNYGRKINGLLVDNGISSEEGELNMTDPSDPRQKLLLTDPSMMSPCISNLLVPLIHLVSWVHVEQRLWPVH